MVTAGADASSTSAFLSSDTITTSVLSTVSLIQSSQSFHSTANVGSSSRLSPTNNPPSTVCSSSQQRISSPILGFSTPLNTLNPTIVPSSSTISSIMSQVASHSRKRKANQKSPSKTPEQGEIDYLKLELNAVRTQVIELESSKRDLERKVKIMTDVIKMYEQRDATNAYKETLPDTAMPHRSNQQSHQLSQCQCHLCNHHSPPPCSCFHLPRNCCLSQHCGYQEGGKSSTLNHVESSDLYTELKATVAKLQDEIVDIVNKFESETPKPMNEQPRKPKPAYRNPNEIPNYDNIEVIAEVEVINANNDDSIVSIDELVPDIAVNHDADFNQLSSLN